MDGDKVNEIQAFKGLHPEISVIHLSTGQEFEQVVSPEAYVQAVQTFGLLKER